MITNVLQSRSWTTLEPTLWGILLPNLTSIGFTNLFRCLIFDFSFFTNADVVTIKDETSKENSWNRCRSYILIPLISRFFFRFLIFEFFFLTNADAVTIKPGWYIQIKLVKPMKVKSRSKISHCIEIVIDHRFLTVILIQDQYCSRHSSRN